MSKVPFHLSGTNDFTVKVVNERLTVVGSSCRQNLKLKTEYLASSFDRLRQRNV